MDIGGYKLFYTIRVVHYIEILGVMKGLCHSQNFSGY